MIESSGLASDSTDIERADAEVLRQTPYLDELFELAPDAIVLTTLRNARIVRINREFTHMFGYTSEEALGRSLRDLVMQDALEPILPRRFESAGGAKN
jgi:PAS domain S-box-containing protein